MNKAVAIKSAGALGKIEDVLINGNLATLSPDDRVSYYKNVCETLGLNPLTKPFDYITLNNKLTLYARKDATDQLRSIYKISIQISARDSIDGVYVVTARAKSPDGREDESTGAVTITGLKGESLANAYMKAETKAKRRVTLSICGLGLLDETEVESIDTEPTPPVATVSKSAPTVAPLKDPTPAAQTKQSVAKEIFATAKQLNLSQADLTLWAKEEFNTPTDKLTLDQMIYFLETLQNELGRDG